MNRRQSEVLIGKLLALLLLIFFIAFSVLAAPKIKDMHNAALQTEMNQVLR